MPRYKLYLPLDQQGFFYRMFAGLLSFFYSFIVNIRNFFYDRAYLPSTKLPGMCISVGNISLGGTGKSPFLMDLAEHLIREMQSPVILTRGYKSGLAKNEFLVLLAGKVIKKNFTREFSNYPDEAMMYAHRLPTVPVLVGRNRVKAALWYLNTYTKPTHWILDDGFQHRQLARDLDIVLLDAQSPWGNGHLLPLGSLREKQNSLSRAHCVVFTRASQDFPSKETEKILTEISKAPTVKLFFDFKIKSLDKNKRFGEENHPVLVACGISQPEKFIGQLEEKGIPIGGIYAVGDHDSFDGKKLQTMLRNCRSVLTTEKDYWRNPSIFQGLSKPCFLAELRIFPTETTHPSIFDAICSFKKNT